MLNCLGSRAIFDIAFAQLSGFNEVPNLWPLHATRMSLVLGEWMDVAVVFDRLELNDVFSDRVNS